MWRNASLTSRMRPVSTSVTVRMVGEISNAARSRSLAPRSLTTGGGPSRPLAEALLQVRPREGLPHPGDPAAVLHLAGAAEEGGEGEPRERAAHADALDARRGQLGQRQRGIAVAHHHVDRLADG